MLGALIRAGGRLVGVLARGGGRLGLGLSRLFSRNAAGKAASQIGIALGASLLVEWLADHLFGAAGLEGPAHAQAVNSVTRAVAAAFGEADIGAMDTKAFVNLIAQVMASAAEANPEVKRIIGELGEEGRAELISEVSEIKQIAEERRARRLVSDLQRDVRAISRGSEDVSRAASARLLGLILNRPVSVDQEDLEIVEEPA